MSSDHEDFRDSPLEMSAEEFRRLGHATVDRLADFLGKLRDLPVGPNEPVTRTRDLLGDIPLPATSSQPEVAVDQAMSLLLEHGVFTSHPRFWAFITGAAAPLGAIGDLIAATLNFNVASWNTAGAASAFEAQAVRWIGELLGVAPSYSGLLLSGGTAANLVSMIAARRSRADWDVRRHGTKPDNRTLCVYASREAHPWLGRAVDITGLGMRAIRWVDTDIHHRLDPSALTRAIAQDRAAQDIPFLVVGSAGTVSLGTVDSLGEIAEICRAEQVWFHVDGAYGGLAACSAEAPTALKYIALADSIAVDAHKWLYVPLEAGCVLLKEPSLLAKTFTYESTFFNYAAVPVAGIPQPYREMGMQNSRGFRALKLWLCLRTAGRSGYERMISDDIRLARRLFEEVGRRATLQPLSNSLSTTVFRYRPLSLPEAPATVTYLNQLNQELLRQLQLEGYAYPSAATIRGVFGIRVCIVNFRTRWSDLEGLIEWCVRRGAELDQTMRPPV